MRKVLQIFGFAVVMLTASLASAQTTATFSIVEQDSLETAAPGSVRSPWRYSNDSTDLFRYVGSSWVPLFDTLYSRNDSLFYVKFGTEFFGAEVSASGGVSDGDKGDITVASSGTSWTIDNSTIGSGNIINGAVGWADLSSAVQDSIQAGGGGISDGDKGDITVASGVWSIDAGTVNTDELAADAVTAAKIADDAVTSDHIATLTADLDMGSNKITDLADPTSDQDAATKAYVDGVPGRAFGVAPGAVKVGKIIDHPTAFTNDKVAPGGVIDMQHIYGDAWPYRLAMIVSPDHLGNSLGGAYLYVADNPEGPWYDYDTVIDSFDVADFPSKPAGNPIFEHPTASDKGEFFDWYQGADGKVYLQGHSNGVGTGQSQWIAESDDGLNFTYLTYMDYPADADGNHSFSYAQIEYWNGVWVSNHVLNDRPTLAYGRSYSLDGRNWRMDPAKIYDRDFVHWGNDSLEIVKTWQRHSINGVDWAVALVRTPGDFGGDNTDGRIAIFPVSSDNRRIAGLGYKIVDAGSASSFDENGFNNIIHTFQDVHGDNPERVYVYYEGIDGSNEGNVGCAYIDPSIVASDLLFTPDSTYSTGVALDENAKPLVVGYSRHKMLDIYPTSTSLPIGVIDTFFNVGTTTQTTTVSPFEAIELITESGDSTNDATHIFKGVDLSDVSDAWFTVEGITTDTDIHNVQMGWIKEDGGTITFPLLLSDHKNATTAHMKYWDGSTYVVDSIRQFGWINPENRAGDKRDISLRVVDIPTQDADTANVFLQVWVGDQIIHNVLANDFERGFYYPFFRVAGDSVSAQYERVTLEVGLPFSYTLGGNTGGFTFDEYSTTASAGGSTSPGGSDGQVQYNDGGAFGGDNDLFWDDANGYLGIGTAGSPSDELHVAGSATSAATSNFVTFENTSSETNAQVRVRLIRENDAGTAHNRGTVIFHSETGSGFANYEAKPFRIYTGASAGSVSERVEVPETGGLQLDNGPTIFTGSGSPENSITAPVGSLYLRTDGGANTTLYIKESGTGNTGWVAK